MPKNKQFEFINTLWNRVVVDVAIPISQEPDTEKEVKDNDLLSHNIHRFLFNPDEEGISLTPSFFSRPMSSAELEGHPISNDFVESTEFVEYTDLTPEFVRENAWDVEASAREACGLVSGSRIAFEKPSPRVAPIFLITADSEE